MTPKEQYEARKAERLRMRDINPNYQPSTTMMLDTLDRFVTAVERIADVMEREAALKVTVRPRDTP